MRNFLCHTRGPELRLWRLLGTNGDGPWRRSPCDREPGPPTATYEAGSSTCLTLHEFVAHPAHYDIQLFPQPVGPGDEVNNGIMLSENVEDPAPISETGYQRFFVDLPEDIDCQESCTIQVRQWVYDLDWYYYACADVRIVPPNATDDNLLVEQSSQSSLSQDQCVWEPAPPRMQAQILQLALLGTMFLLDAILIVTWSIWVYYASQHVDHTKPDDASSINDDDVEAGSKHDALDTEKETQDDGESNENTEADTDEPAKQGCWNRFWMEARSSRRKKRAGFAIVVWVVMSAAVVAIVLVGLKACWFGS